MSEYKKLSQFILDNQSALCEKIEGLSLITENETIKNACVEYIGMLTRRGSEYMNQLSLLEQDLLAPILKIMDVLYATDAKLGQSESMGIEKQDEIAQHKHQKRRKGRMQKELGKSLAGVAAGTVLASLLKPGAFGVILLGSVVSVIVSGVLYEIYMEKSKDQNEHEVDAVPSDYCMTSKDVENIVKGLVSVGESVDRVLLTYRRHLEILEEDFRKKEKTYDLEKKYIGVLECFQSLLGNLADMDESPIVYDSVRKITQTLYQQGFKAVDYGQDMVGLFNTKEDDVEVAEQFTPAIVKISGNKETLILKGDVVIPKAR